MIAPFSSPFTLALTHLYSLRTTLQTQKMDQTENNKIEVSNGEVQTAGTEATKSSETSLKVKQLQDMVDAMEDVVHVFNLIRCAPLNLGKLSIFQFITEILFSFF